MQATFKTISEVRQEVAIEVTSDELAPHFESAYEEFRPKAELKGFRKGKVPMEMIKKLYGEAIENDALDKIAGEFFRQAVVEKNIEPIGQPMMNDMHYHRGEHFHFTISYEVKPKITLKSYKGVAVDRPVHTVTDAEINAEVEHLRRSNAQMTEVTAVTDPDHLVTVDVQELDDADMPLIGKKSAGQKFLLSDERLQGEIKTALSAAETGKSYRTTFQHQHDDHTHTVRAMLNVIKIEKLNLPAFDDEFVKKITGGKTESAATFLADLRKDIESYWNEQSDRGVNDAIAQALVKDHDFIVPDSLVEGFLDTFVDDIKNRSHDKKLPAGFNEQKFREESREYAAWQAKWFLLKDRIAEEEKLKAEDADFERLAEKDAARMGVGKDRILDFYKKSREVAERVQSDKLMKFLRDNAKVKNVEMKNETGV